MDFAEIYQASVTIKKTTGLDDDPFLLIPNLYSYERLSEEGQLPQDMLRLYAGGQLFFDDLCVLSFQPMDTALLLYTTSGSGALTCHGQTVFLGEGQLLFFDCNQNFSLQGSILPWSFQIYFLGGGALSFFCKQAGAYDAPQLTLSEFSTQRRELQGLLGVPTEVTLTALIQMQAHLNQILSTFCLSLLPEAAPAKNTLPSYLTELKDWLDHHYMEPFSLEQLEERLCISKYRLCREFSAQFGQPPLRYLNLQRLSAAKKMLLVSELNIQTISSIVGFDNVNHFIHLFKKYEGVTPGAFRQMVPEDRPVSHSPAR